MEMHLVIVFIHKLVQYTRVLSRVIIVNGVRKVLRKNPCLDDYNANWILKNNQSIPRKFIFNPHGIIIYVMCVFQ